MRNLINRLSSLDIYLVTLCVALSMLKADLLPVAALVGGFFWLLRLGAQGWQGVRSPGDGGIFLVLLMSVISATWTTVLPEKTLPQVWRLLAGIGFYCAVANWPRRRSELRLIGNGLVLLALGLALFAPIGVIWAMKLSFIPVDLYERFAPIVEDTANPNVLAGSLILFLPLAPALLLNAWRDLRWPERLLALVTTFLGTGLLLLTQSRSAWVAFGVAIFLMCLLSGRVGRILAGLAAIGGVVSVFLLGYGRLEALVLGSQGGLSGRIAIWQRAIFMLQDFPVTGVGMGLFTEVADTLYPFADGGLYAHAHNLFLQVGVDLGLPGLIGWLAVSFVSLAAAWQAYRLGHAMQSKWMAGLGIGLLAGQLALVAHGLFDAVTWGQVRPAPVVWALWGAAAAAARLAQHPPGAEKANLDLTSGE